MEKIKSEIVLEEYENVTSELIKLISSLREEQLNIKPANQGWTIAQIGQHLNLSYEVSAILEGNVEEVNRDPCQKLPEIQLLFLNFDIKMDSPKEILPPEGFIKKESLLNSLKSKIEWCIDFSKQMDVSKLCLDFEIPEYGPFTRLEWIGFNTVHTQRHIHQIKQIKKSLGI